MAYTGYFKSEVNVGAKVNGWMWLETFINSPICRTTRKLTTGSQHFIRQCVTPLNIYCHQEAAPEPITDGHILTSIFDDAEQEYSGPAGYIHSFTSSTGIFTSNQNLDLQPYWTVYYCAKNTGVSDGYIGHFKVEVYKRNISNSDTLLFQSVYAGVPGVYPTSGFTMLINPDGVVTTTDRLRIRIRMYEDRPT